MFLIFNKPTAWAACCKLPRLFLREGISRAVLAGQAMNVCDQQRSNENGNDFTGKKNYRAIPIPAEELSLAVLQMVRRLWLRISSWAEARTAGIVSLWRMETASAPRHLILPS